jgi:hypothetical protein
LTPSKRDLYLRLVKLLAAFVSLSLSLSLSTLAQSNSSSRGGAAVCPLSDSQTQKSIEAFAKIVPTLTEEPRCVNCHGGVNPFIDGTTHPEGPLDRTTDCSGCHSNMVPRTRATHVNKHGELDNESVWRLPPDFLSFLGKDAPTLCKQIKDFSRGCDEGAGGVSTCGPWPDAKKFIAHITDDEGQDNFTGTAFKGDRGLDREMFPEKEIPSQPPPNINPAELIKLGEDWVATTGGEFKGDKDCGCEPAHYAIRVSVSNETNRGPVHHKSALQPVDIPITFEDDGTFSGEAVADFKGAVVVSPCKGEYADSLNIRASGQATETAEEQSMHLKFENTSPVVSSVSVQCPYGSASKQGTHSGKTTLPFDFEGDVGEFLDYSMPNIPGLVSKTHLEIVKLAKPQK